MLAVFILLLQKKPALHILQTNRLYEMGMQYTAVNDKTQMVLIVTISALSVRYSTVCSRLCEYKTSIIYCRRAVADSYS